jgi:hypothetical protein
MDGGEKKVVEKDCSEQAVAAGPKTAATRLCPAVFR